MLLIETPLQIVVKHTVICFLSDVVIQICQPFPWLHPEDTLQLPIDYLVVGTYSNCGKWDFFNREICLVSSNSSWFIIPGIQKWGIKKIAIITCETKYYEPKQPKRKFESIQHCLVRKSTDDRAIIYILLLIPTHCSSFHL